MISKRLRIDSDEIWKKILEHPFVLELYSGTLPMDKFKFYVLQDYNYLIADMRNFSLLASKAPDLESLKEMLEIAHLEATSELNGYERLLKELGYRIEDARGIEHSLITKSYTSFLLATSSLKTFWEGLAATLPCFWTYSEIYDHNKERLKKNENRIYKEWAEIYSSDSYRDLVDKLIKILNKADIKYDRLKEAFLISSKYEYMYWDMVYAKGDSF